MTPEQAALIDLLQRVQRLEVIEEQRTFAAHVKAVAEKSSEQDRLAGRPTVQGRIGSRWFDI